MKAFRVWCVFFDGTFTIASAAYEKRSRADGYCASLIASHQERAPNGELVQAYDVREEEIPGELSTSTGAFPVTTIVLGDDTAWTVLS